MSLTPEQFNKLVTKDEFVEVRSEFKEVHKKLNRIIEVLDTLVRKNEITDHELTSNQAAHDRFEMDIESLKERVAKIG